MSRSTVDSGALNLAIDMLKRNAERHGQPSMLEAAEALQQSAATEAAVSCETCKHSKTSGILPKNYFWCSKIVTDLGRVAGSDGIPFLSDNGELMIPVNFHCKLWEKKDECPNS